MDKNKFLLFLFLYFNVRIVNTSPDDPINLLKSGDGHLFPYPEKCLSILEAFAKSASNFTMCSILHARPINLCEKCINQYLDFIDTYESLNTIVNGTSCKSLFLSHDRLDAILQYHDNILNVWDQGHCIACYDWSNTKPVLSNETKHFLALYNETITCIQKYRNSSGNNSDEVCGKCMQSYLQLDSYYKSLSSDSIGLDYVCMDIVDSMNATRSIWSKSLNCCKVRKSPEIVFLCCTGIISLLPLLYYVVLRYCGPIKDLPNVLKQSRFKQTILRSVNRRIN